MIATSGYNLTATSNNPKYPIFKIEYFDTPYCVPTRGYGVKYYEDPDQSSSSTFDNKYQVLEGKDNILSYDWGFGAPAGISNTDYFKAKYFGYFYAKFTGSYTFFVSKEATDYFRFFLETSTPLVVSGPYDSSQYSSTRINEWKNSTGDNYQGVETRQVSITLTEGQWYPFLLEFAERQKSAYLSLRYREPDAVRNSAGEWSDYDTIATGHRNPVEHRKVMSAGVASYEATWANRADAQFISGKNIDCVDSVTINKTFNQSNTIEIKIPLLNNVQTTSGLKGFRFHNQSKLYYDDNQNIFLREGRMIRYYSGYSSNTTSPISSNYIQRFEGIITDIKVDKNNNRESFITVVCQDILYNSVSSIFENFPNNASYVNFDFSSSTEPEEPNGQTRPETYDSWPLVDVIRDLYVKSGIDPTKLYGRKKVIDRNNQLKYTDYFIEDRDIILKRRINYGNPNAVGFSLNSDDKYIWSFNFGDQIYDGVSKFADNYGFVVEVTNEGYPTFSSINSSYVDIEDASWTVVSSDFEEKFDIRADGGKYLACINNGGTIEKIVKGSAFVLNFIKKNTNIDPGFYGWTVPYNEFPSSVARYDTSNNAQLNRYWEKLGILYGRIPRVANTLVGFEYYTGSIILRPKRQLTVNSVEYTFYSDTPSAYDNSIDFGCYADIYFGQVIHPNYRDLVTSTLVFSKYKRKNRIANFTDKIDLTTSVSISSGNTYAFKFVTKDDIIPSSQIIQNAYATFSIRNCVLNPNGNNLVHKNTVVDTAPFNPGAPVYTNYDYVVDSSFSIGVYPDFRLIGNEAGGFNSEDKTQIDIYGKDLSNVFNLISSYTIENTYFDRFSYDKPLRYPSDGPDFTGTNPCKFIIFGHDIGLNSGGTIYPYGEYLIAITNLATSNIETGTILNSIESFDIDVYCPTWEFNTSTNITNLGLSETLDDIRNDVIVVGDLLGAFRDYTTKEVINKNNPYLEYVYSKATDISSINNPDSLNNVGKKKPFIIYEPTITDQKHCDWLAQAILYRYNTFRKIPNWTSYGIPFLETNDNVFIVDNYGGSIIGENQNSNNQWIVSLNESVSHTNYSSNINTTPYAPWTSYAPSKNPSIDDFGGNAFINIRMTDSNLRLRGYSGFPYDRFDVYETEISGNKLTVRYDQVIDGDIIVKVMSKNSLGIESEDTIAYLVGKATDQGEIPEYREWGTDYVLNWDGVDQTGASRRKIGQTAIATGAGSAAIINNIDYISSYTEAGFFVTSGDYFLRFTIFPRDRSIQSSTIDTKKLDKNYNKEISDLISNTNDVYEQTWRVKWGNPPDIYLTVSGKKQSSSVRNITYYPNNVFYENENDGNGILFTLYASGINNNNRNIYYAVDIDHIWGLGYTFVLRNDNVKPYTLGGAYHQYSSNNATNWKIAYEKAIQGYYSMQRGDTSFVLVEGLDPQYSIPPPSDITAGDWHTAGFVSGGILDEIKIEDNAGKFVEGLEELVIDSNQTIVTSGSRYRVICWHNVPYTSYHIGDYIPSTILKYSDNNKIQFYFNPETAIGGAWNFLAAPDLSKKNLDLIRKEMALGVYYSGPTATGVDERIKLITSHAFQIKVSVWDGTGRLLKNDAQIAGKPALPHRHGLWNANTASGYSINNLMLQHTHNLYSQTLNLQTIKMAPSIHNDRSTLWGGDYLKDPYIDYDMTVSGLPFVPSPIYNYGIGYCKVSGAPNYGKFTWHGYWLSDNNLGNRVEYSVPTNHKEIGAAMHWIKYPATGDELYLSKSIIKWDTGMSIGDTMILEPQFVSTDLGTSLKLALSGSQMQYKHSHFPVHEGINSGHDMLGIVDYMTSGNFVELYYATNVSDSTIGWYARVNDNPFKYVRYDVYKVQSDFPKIWYQLDITLPWATGVNAYRNFTPSGGFIFPHGGYSSKIDDTQ